MALTAVRRYRHDPHVMANGQILYLPGSTIFNMRNGLPSEVDIYTVGTTQLFPLGTRVVDQDRVYRYVEFGGTTKAADLVQAEAPAAAHDDLDASGVLQGAAITADSKLLEVKGPGSGTDDFIADEYSGGLMFVEVDTGLGYAYPVETHEALDISNAAARMLVQIKHGLAVAIDSTSNIGFLKSKYKEVIICPTTLTAQVAGVSVGVGADGSFGWLATRGPAAVRMDLTAAIAVGNPVVPSAATAGEVQLFDASGTVDLPLIGRAAFVPSNDSEVGIVDLYLE